MENLAAYRVKNEMLAQYSTFKKLSVFTRGAKFIATDRHIFGDIDDYMYMISNQNRSNEIKYINTRVVKGSSQETIRSTSRFGFRISEYRYSVGTMIAPVKLSGCSAASALSDHIYHNMNIHKYKVNTIYC